MKIIPQQSRIIVELIDDSTIGAIALPEKREELEFFRSRVVAVGPGRTLENGDVIPIPLKPGDEVFFDARFAARFVPKALYGGRELAVVDYAGVQAVIERDPKEPVYTPPVAIRRAHPVLTH